VIEALLLAAVVRPEISFWSGFAHPQVYVMAADGRGARALTNLYSAKRGAWSPDGKRLAFDGRFHETVTDFDIGVMNADGSRLRRITRGPGRDVAAAWSPDGTWLAFSRRRTELAQPDVWLVRPDGRDAHRLVGGGAPAWSPSGRWIAFDAPGGVYAVRPDGSGRHRLVVGNVGSLKWSPDGRRVAYTSWAHNTSEIYLARGDGSGARRLTRNRADVLRAVLVAGWPEDSVHARPRQRARRVRHEPRRHAQAAAHARRRLVGDVLASALVQPDRARERDHVHLARAGLP
jgi:Tol biopolymer transport system component